MQSLGLVILTYDQRFKFSESDWSTPNVNWNKVHCHTGGTLEHTITIETSYTDSLTSETALEISAKIEGKVKFIGGVEVTTTVSTSIAKTWESSYGTSSSTLVKCLNNEDGTPFTGGYLEY